jgi:hypothetical protein
MESGTQVDVRALCGVAAVLLSGTAAVLVLVILIGGSENVASKALSFAFTFALFTLPAAAGVYLARERPALLWLGGLTTIAAIVAFVAVVAALWHGSLFEGGGDWKTAGVFTLVSMGTGQAALILSLARAGDSQLATTLRWVGVIPLAILTIVGAEDISSRHGEGAGARTYGILGVLYVLGMVLPPLVGRATRDEYEDPLG